MSIRDRRLIDVLEQIPFSTNKDFRRFLPRTLAQPFSNKLLAEKMKDSLYLAQKITYCLKKMGLLREVGKKGNELLFTITD